MIESTLLPDTKSVTGIRFAVPAEDAPDRIAFAYSPLQEAVLSLHVLVAPTHHALQHDWVALGPDAFVFEVLDTLAPPEDQPGYDPTDDLRTLEQLWRERLQPFGDRGYMKR